MRFVYAIAFAGKKFVMVRHKNRAWEMPGGLIDEGEAPEEAVEREFREETGMNFEFVSEQPLADGIVYFGIAEGWPKQISEEIAAVALFDKLPGHLSFPRDEYERMLQEARVALKNYIRGDSIVGSAPSD